LRCCGRLARLSVASNLAVPAKATLQQRLRLLPDSLYQGCPDGAADHARLGCWIDG
jgi:hypothetical protein